jgi:hypothetical protein
MDTDDSYARGSETGWPAHVSQRRSVISVNSSYTGLAYHLMHARSKVVT